MVVGSLQTQQFRTLEAMPTYWRQLRRARDTLRLYVDTEFTDFLDCDLISIAIVSADGREFYGERSDFDLQSCSEFVRAASRDSHKLRTRAAAFS